MITSLIMQSSINLHLLLALSSVAQNLKRCVNVYKHQYEVRIKIGVDSRFNSIQ